MSNAFNIKQLFPWTATQPDLDGSSAPRGLFGFGTVPTWACAPIASTRATTRATGWRPMLVSLAYVTLNERRVHDVRIELFEKQIPDGMNPTAAPTNATPLVAGTRWLEVPLDQAAIRVAYLTGIPVPVSDDTGNPFGLRIITEGRLDPSSVVIDWEWAQADSDISMELLAQLAGRSVELFVRRIKDEIGGLVRELRGGG